MTRTNDLSATLVSATTILVLGAFILLGAFAIETPRTIPISTGVMLHFSINTLIVLAALFLAVRARPYSLHLFHLIGLVIFVCVAGMYQYLTGSFPIAGPTVAFRREIPVANIATTLWVLAYLSGYATRSALSSRLQSGAAIRSFEKPVGIASVYFSLIVGIVALIYLASLGLIGAFTRAAASETLLSAFSGRGPLFLINIVFVRALPLLAVAGTALAMRHGKMSFGTGLFVPMFVIEVVGVVVTNNPFAAARYWFVAVAVGLSAPHLLARRKTGVLLLVCAILGFSVLPSIGDARRAETLAEISKHYLRIDSPVEYLATSGDVDSFGMMALAIKWKETHGPRGGMQMLGAALFWVPRAIWPSKPVGTGSMITKEMGFEFTNFSVPIIAEPLVDFGLIAVPFFAFLFGWVLSSIDRSYWSHSNIERSPIGCRRIDIIYPFWAGLMLFMTRGDLLSSFGYTVGITLAMIPFVLVPGRVRARLAKAEDDLDGSGSDSDPFMDGSSRN